MQKLVTQPVPYLEHPTVEPPTRFNWEDVRVFLSVARSPSFRSVACELGLSFNTVRRHIERLEKVSKAVLIVRHSHGIELTQEGRDLFDIAVSMEEAAIGVGRVAEASGPGISGRLRLSITEGLGTFWLVPRLVTFQRAHPNVLIEANCTFREADMARMEVDISIQLSPPRCADTKAVRLGRMHVMPFASAEYLRIFGTPKCLADVQNHKIVEQLSPQLDVSAIDKLFPGRPREGFVAMSTNTSTAHFWGVASGAGLGMLPTYVVALGAKVVPVDLDLVLHHDIWLSYHPDAKRQRRVALAVDWLRENFNPKKFPWFGDSFIHPRDLPANEPWSSKLGFI